MNILPAWMNTHHIGRVCGWVCVHVCACVLTQCWGVPKKGIGYSGTQLQKAVSYHVGAGDCIWPFRSLSH